MLESNIELRIALFEPQIPQNTGTILRMADCFNLTVDIILPCGFIFGGKEMKRAGMDYLSTVKYNLVEDFNDYLNLCKINNNRIILATTKSNTPYYNINYKEKDIILFGSETKGVPEFIHNTVTDKITIPMLANKRSLNLAVSCGIIVSEALKQITLNSKKIF